MKYAKEIKNQIIDDYKNGINKKELSIKYNIPLTTLCHWINNMNAIKISKKSKEKLKDIIIQEYINGSNTVKLCNKYNIVEGTVNLWIKPYARQRGVVNKIGNEDFFDTVDTERKAYYLGWLMADGNVSVYDGQYSLKVHLNTNDRELIDNFMKDLKCTNSVIDRIQVKNGKKYYSTYVSLTSRHMVESLFKVGIIPQKTGKETLPDIPNNLIRHFIRGFFDGDGTICNRKDGRTAVGFVGNEIILESIRDVLKWHRLSISNCKNCDTLKQIQCSSKNDLIIFYNYMYDDANIFLTRKKDKFDFFIASTEVTCVN